MKSKYYQRTHKYGSNIPKYVNEEYNIDAENRNNYWRDVSKQEMEKVRVSFKECKVVPDNFLDSKK